MAYKTFLELPAGSIPRERVRQLHRYLSKNKDTKNVYLGLEGRKLNFQFETQEGAETFLTALKAMFDRRNTQTVNKEEYVDSK